MADHDGVGHISCVEDFDDISGQPLHAEITIGAHFGAGRLAMSPLIDGNATYVGQSPDHGIPVVALLREPVQEDYGQTTCFEGILGSEFLESHTRAVRNRNPHTSTLVAAREATDR